MCACVFEFCAVLLTVVITTRCRDLVYFNDAWISRIKPDVGDNWRLKVSYSALGAPLIDPDHRWRSEAGSPDTCVRVCFYRSAT